MSNSPEQYIKQHGKGDIESRLSRMANYFRTEGSISDITNDAFDNLSEEDRIESGMEIIVGFLNFATDFETLLNPTVAGKEMGTVDIDSEIASDLRDTLFKVEAVISTLEKFSLNELQLEHVQTAKDFILRFKIYASAD